MATGWKGSANGREPKILPSGECTLDEVPLHVVVSVLARVTNTWKSFWMNQPDQDNVVVFLWLMGGNPKRRLPRPRMSLGVFETWAVSEIAAGTIDMKAYRWGAELCDLDWELGCINLFAEIPAYKFDGERVITHVVLRESGAIATLPETFQPMVKDVGTIWQLRDNFAVDRAYITNTKTHEMLYLGLLFVPASRSVGHPEHIPDVPPIKMEASWFAPPERIPDVPPNERKGGWWVPVTYPPGLSRTEKRRYRGIKRLEAHVGRWLDDFECKRRRTSMDSSSVGC